MDENIVQYVWQHRLYSGQQLRTIEGDSVEVLYQGDLNRNAGPDFFNARLRIAGTLWAGNVEVHTRSDDWYAHGHHTESRCQTGHGSPRPCEKAESILVKIPPNHPHSNCNPNQDWIHHAAGFENLMYISQAASF